MKNRLIPCVLACLMIFLVGCNGNTAKEAAQEITKTETSFPAGNTETNSQEKTAEEPESTTVQEETPITAEESQSTAESQTVATVQTKPAEEKPAETPVTEKPKAEPPKQTSTQTLYVKRDVGDSVAVAQCVAQELGHAQLSINSDSYSRADMGFQAVCIGYMLCKKYGVDTQNFAINRIPEKLASKEPKDIRYELSKTRNAMADIHSRVSDELYKKKQERSKDYER